MNWKRTILTWVVVFGLLFLITNWYSKKKQSPEETNGVISVSMSKKEYSQDEEVIVKIQNNTEKNISLAFACPKNPFKVLEWDGSQYAEKIAETKIDCSQFIPLTVEPKKSSNVTYTYWNHALFGTPGRFKIEVPVTIDDEQQIFSTEEFIIEESGTWGRLSNVLFYRPLFNLLVVLTKYSPFKDLGFAIIILTLIVRLLVLIPSQKALKAQKRMQDLQPKLDTIKKQYAGNQERIAQETMGLWKKEKVNPFGSCLPLLIQFPFLIAIYYVIRNGLNPDSSYLLYGALKNFDFQMIHTNFLGILELTKINIFVLPLIVGILQFLQMKLAMAKKSTAGAGSEMQQANQMMVYIMPVMIALFTASVPAGVGLYWGISTVFGIGQQVYVNRKG